MTDNITLPRQTVQQALEALQNCANGEDDVLLTRNALADLRAALEQHQAEPVAFVNADNLQGLTLGHYGYIEIYTGESAGRVPLYTAPPQRKPLMDEQADQIISGLQTCHHQSSKREFLKVWLRDWAAHGIKEGA